MALNLYRLAVCDPLEQRKPVFFGRLYKPSEQQRLQADIQEARAVLDEQPDMPYIVAALPVAIFQLGYWDPTLPDMAPIMFGRRYSDTPCNRRRMLAALKRFNALFAADPRCTCLIGVFEAPAKAKV